MRSIPILFTTTIVIAVMHTSCYAGCNCDDWMQRDGYCVDYIKDKIPIFPIPTSDAEISALKNKDVSEVAAGDVAIFDLGNYWHVAYVEKVHLDSQGRATAIDVSEMNYGKPISFADYKKRWGTTDENEWKRALCCGVTKRYDRMSSRKDVALSTVNQVWSPVTAAFEDADEKRGNAVVERVKEVINRFFNFMGRDL